MSIESDDKRYPSMPGAPTRHLANAGTVSVPPLEPAGTIIADQSAAAKERPAWEAADELAVRLEPSAGSPAKRSARDPRAAGANVVDQDMVADAARLSPGASALDNGQAADAAVPASKVRKTKAVKDKAQAPDAADRAQHPGAVTRPAQEFNVPPAAGIKDGTDAVAAAKSPRARRAMSKTSTVPDQGISVVGAASAVRELVAPAITPEAVTFLSDPNAKATELFKLHPESQAFVQYHFKNVLRLDAAIDQGYGNLALTAPKFSSTFEKVADALMTNLAKDRRDRVVPAKSVKVDPVAAPAPALSYSPKTVEMGAYHAIPVRLGTMDIQPSKSVPGQQEASTGPETPDIRRAYSVIGTAHVMMSAQIGEVTREQAADLVAGDIAEVRTIRDDRARRLALSAMMDSSQAQPNYKGEFERLAPDLVAPATEASAAMAAESSASEAKNRFVPSAGEQTAMNTIERGIAPEKEHQSATLNRPAPSVDPATPDVKESGQAQAKSYADPAAPYAAPSAPMSTFGNRLLRAVSIAWQLSKEERRPALAEEAKPVSLHKEQVSAGFADDKANLVPDAVMRRFLKVEDDYYFPDRTLAFRDRGNKLATRGAHPEVVRSLVEIAKARGWNSITVKGDEEFRRSAWMEAAQAGLTVAGYKPTAVDLAELGIKPVANTVEKGLAKDRENAPKQPAVAQPVMAEAATRTPQGAASKDADSAPNPEWTAKAKAFEKEKPSFVMKKHPDLAQAYGVVDAAKKFADANLAVDARDEFVSLARRHVMQKIIAGDQVKGPRVYMAPIKTKDATEQTQAPTSQATDQGKPARSKEVARER